MAMTVTMPQLGESVTEGTIARWLKQPGELVAKYESIAEVVTDKVNAEIPAPAEGSMGEHIAQEGAVVAVGEPICTIETVEQGQANSAWHQGDEAAPAEAANVSVAEQAPMPEQPAPAEQEHQPEVVQQEEPQQREAVTAGAQQSAAPVGQEQGAPPQPAHGNGNGSAGATYHLTPAVRMLVREHEVDLAQVQGTGLEGRISKKDVLDYVQRRDASGGAPPPAPAQPATQAQPTAGGQPAPATQPAPAAAPQPQRADGDELIPLTPTRRAIAEHMVRSRHVAPHAWMMMEVDMSRVAKLRTTRRAEFEQRYGAKLTYLPFVARAVCDALRQYPTLNSSWSDEGIIIHRDLNLGIAVALEDNLIVPVIRNADRLNIAGLAATMQDLGDRARANKLKLDEIQGGTFTLNNTGALGTVLTQAIINQPQAGILAMDAVIKRAVVVNDAIAIRPMMNIGLSFDHRINDGLQATRFVKKVKELLEGIDDSGALL
ncbi:MAG: 2-oxo acid dehydrogenase subunit E2 [Candidatus Dormibacteraeota bacterium]|uniref:Dihydrolipoamide acetyltransferase component of pyruvate dehydrogenase complex n=1 Tax=Candidatus Aeolococcus gillhamiae TaxID=3127015 RepID=A0A2W5YYH5_9BACT|nr:2-oxo acid dehydrogenase subunit E2 [Candidatus Dormibacteraeota bacterium]PZR78039.1 MAG: branched-chain alpha-keto acid dehydrogenase subunit E2 [Candidatus Dormibacter sp. RRmetagenome_bin12]